MPKFMSGQTQPGGAPNDVVRVDRSITLPGRIEGGGGNDRLQAGSGAEALLGGDGDDMLIGGGCPSLDGGSGRDPVVIARPLGTILVGPSASASSQALRILGQGYRLARLENGNGASTGPIVVGAADLDRPAVVRRLIESYDAGQTVALANATPDDAERLRAIVGHDSPARWAEDVPMAALVAFRKVALDGGRSQSETTVVMPRQAAPVTKAAAAAGKREADRRELERLTTVFAASPVVAEAPGGSSNLLNLTRSYISRNIQTDVFGNEIQVVNTAYGARSFLNKSDFFYVFQEADFHAYAWARNINHGLTTSGVLNPAANPVIIQPSPQTTMTTTSVTSGVSYTIGGSIGFNGAQGFNASISGSVTISNSKTTTYPPITLYNRTNLGIGAPEFVYKVEEPQQAARSTLTFYNHWIWQIPFNEYAGGQTSIHFQTTSALTYNTPTSDTQEEQLIVFLNSWVPTPFGDTFALRPPKVASVSTNVVKPGQTFTIAGSGFYPSLVSSLLIGGQPLPAANFQVVSDKEITVIAPDTPGVDLPVVVQTTEGFSNDSVPITIG
jgi:hypothetical protein